MSSRIGFVGVGKMGANMARHLKDKGWSVTSIYDINQDVAAQLATELGATNAATLAEVTAASDTIITVVTNDDAMRSIFSGNNLLAGAAGKTFINCATLSPGIHREVEKAAHAVGAKSLEACMASSISHAREGKLYLMLAGDESVFHEQKSLLEELSTNMRFVPGGTGKAAEVKALVNMVMNINTAALAEGLGIGAALGIGVDLLREVFSQTGANSRVLETDSEDMRDRSHDCWFSAEHAAKDSGIAAQLAQSVGVHAPLNDATVAQYSRMVKLGLGDLDKSGIAELTFPGRCPASDNQTSNTSNNMIIPTISSGIAGPLGVLHMPRFWQKVSLSAVGKLHSDYPACGGGYDRMMLSAIGLDEASTLDYIRNNKPSYVQFEAWVRANASNLGGAADFNEAVIGYNHDDATRESILNLVGLPGANIKDAVNLNNLEDWHEFHRTTIA